MKKRKRLQLCLIVLLVGLGSVIFNLNNKYKPNKLEEKVEDIAANDVNLTVGTNNLNGVNLSHSNRIGATILTKKDSIQTFKCNNKSSAGQSCTVVMKANIKQGYKFIGWSSNFDCSAISDKSLTYTIKFTDNDSKKIYACVQSDNNVSNVSEKNCKYPIYESTGIEKMEMQVFDLNGSWKNKIAECGKAVDKSKLLTDLRCYIASTCKSDGKCDTYFSKYSKCGTSANTPTNSATANKATLTVSWQTGASVEIYKNVDAKKIRTSPEKDVYECSSAGCNITFKINILSGYTFKGWSRDNCSTIIDKSTYRREDFSSNQLYVCTAKEPVASTTKCTIDIPKNTNNKNNFYETWEIYDDGKFMLSGGTGTSTNYLCKYDNCYVKFIKLDSKRTFNGIAGDGDCSTGGRNGTKETKILKCTNSNITAKACYTDEYANNSSLPTVTEPTISNDNTESINRYVYANGGEYGGNSITCGDKIYITTCSNNICNVTTINGKEVSSTTQIRKTNYVINESETGCYQKIDRYIAEKTSYYTNQNMTENKTDINCGSIVTFKKSIESSCSNNVCEVEYDGKIVYIDKKYITSDKPTCSSTSTCETTSKQTNIKGETTVKICAKDDNENTRNSIVTCASDYSFEYKMTKDNSLDSNENNRYKEYLYNCTYTKRPMVTASGAIANSKGYGTINATGYDYGNYGIYGFFISNGIEPTVNDAWVVPKSDNTFSIEESVGSYFIWVMNNKHRISYPMLVKVYDSDLSTTLATFGVKDSSGNDINVNMSSLDGTIGYYDTIVDSKYALLSNKLIADNSNGFDKYTTAYEMTVNSNKIALYATLTSSDASYVTGYEPRTIDLEYGRNVALIKIVNKDGKERCYTFIINRVDDRNNSNLLKNIKLSRGSIDFDPYVTNYDVTISRFTKKVSVNAELDSSTSSFIAGYEPREVEITEDNQSVVLKVISEAGSIRSYVITFNRKGDSEDTSNSTYLSSLTVPGTMLGFDKKTYDYTITVPYETVDIPIYAFAESETAFVTVGNNIGLKVGNNLIQIEVKNNNKTRIYSLHVIRKESGLDISDSAKLGTLSIKNYNLEFSPDKLDYEVKIKREKTLLITATPESNRADIYMYGNNDLTGFSTVRVKVIAENGLTNIYSIDIQKAAYNKKIEIILSISICLFVTISGIIIIVNRKNKINKEYMEG